jgi:hypothetical protein
MDEADVHAQIKLGSRSIQIAQELHSFLQIFRVVRTTLSRNTLQLKDRTYSLVKIRVVIVKEKLEKDGEDDGEDHIDLETKVHGLLPHLEFVLMRFVVAINRKHFVLELRKYSICGKNLVFIHHASISRRVVENASIDIILARPLLLDNPIHNSGVKKAIQIKLIQVPEAIISLIVDLLHQKHDLIRVVIHIKHRL